MAPGLPTSYHGLNPLTKAVLASVATLAAVAFGGYAAPTLVFAALVLPGAIVGRVAGRVFGRAALLTLPLAIAVALVSVFTRPGATVLLTIGPFDAALEGVDFAAKVIVRLFVMASALVLFGSTTTSRDLVVDLERRGVSPRFAFALGANAGTVPALIERARDVRDAQRSRALDTEGSLRRRLGGIMPLVGPVVIGSLHEVEARSLALEARAFGRPGPRHLLWAPADTTRQRALRWLLITALVLVIGGSAAGFIARLP